MLTFKLINKESENNYLIYNITIIYYILLSFKYIILKNLIINITLKYFI